MEKDPQATDTDASTFKGREVPTDLFIPPDALEVITQDFEGPLDLLLYLIRKNSFDVLNIPVAEIADQYARYIDLMQKIQLELAGEYLAMAATLAQIKSRLLLPPKSSEAVDEEEIDPRLELARRLQQYEIFRNAAEMLNGKPRVGREIFVGHAKGVVRNVVPIYELVELSDLIEAFQGVLQLADQNAAIVMQRENISVKDTVDEIVNRLKSNSQLRFDEIFDKRKGRAGMVVAFLALLELINSGRIYAIQADSNSPIHIRLTD
ncbi:MAG: ScpA family protein [Acidiferrobacterales bacterium]|nr:ScpA family protein [Acidiferrobacterales bacterium]